eukprot:6212236-Pleurochrysis_carterae.AAC.4
MKGLYVVAHGLACLRTANGGSIWPSSLPAKRRRGTLASAAITVRSDAEVAVKPRDAILMKRMYFTHINVMN